jgi:hypothetical protein
MYTYVHICVCIGEPQPTASLVLPKIVMVQGVAVVKTVAEYVGGGNAVCVVLQAECDNPYDTTFRPERILVYDTHPGGIGLAAQVSLTVLSVLQPMCSDVQPTAALEFLYICMRQIVLSHEPYCQLKKACDRRVNAKCILTPVKETSRVID